MIDAVHRALQKITGRMSLALRVAVLTTAAVALTLGVVSAVAFVTVRAEFESSLDESMLRRANAAVDSGYSQALQTSESVQALAYLGILPFIVEGGRLFTSDPATSTEFAKAKGVRGWRSRSANASSRCAPSSSKGCLIGSSQSAQAPARPSSSPSRWSRTATPSSG
ncbi:hypothetical protein [Aeromicrobium sp. UC242_57]|uniref:hypothetical protein n=1 Tax=Aeromicrobium sp. UC242_57 TaxID=3374624 RepID=UPI0037A055BF